MTANLAMVGISLNKHSVQPGKIDSKTFPIYDFITQQLFVFHLKLQIHIYLWYSW